VAVDLDALGNPRQDDFNIGELAQLHIGFDLIGVSLDDDVAAESCLPPGHGLMGLTSGALLKHEANHGRHESHSQQVRLSARARRHAAVCRQESSFWNFFRGIRR